MLNWIREKFSRAVLVTIVLAIAGIFVLSDFLSPRGSRGLGRGAGGDAGSVNGEVVTRAEFSRELNRRTESLKQMMGGKVSEEQLRMFRIREGVFNEIVQRKLVLQECRKSGLVPADEEVRAKIQDLPYFKKDGKFDLAAYKAVLANNGYSPGKFEEMVRDDLMMEKWNDGIRSRVQVSDDEVRRAFRSEQDKRSVKYVVLSNTPKPEKKGEAKADIQAENKVEDVRKTNALLAEQLIGLLGAGGDARVNALLKDRGVTVKSTGLVAASALNLEGFGDSKDIAADAFAAKSPIDVRSGGKAKKYESPMGVAIAVVVDSKAPAMDKLAAETSRLEQQLRSRKTRELEEQWIQGLREKARIKTNDDVVGGTAGV